MAKKEINENSIGDNNNAIIVMIIEAMHIYFKKDSIEIFISLDMDAKIKGK